MKTPKRASPARKPVAKTKKSSVKAAPKTPPGQEAVAVLRRFLDASMKKNEARMRACLTRASLESGQLKAGPEGVKFEIGKPATEGKSVVVPVKGVPIKRSKNSPQDLELDCVMVQEDGDWKLDLRATLERMMGGSLEAALGQVGAVMGKVMEGVGEAMTSALGASEPDGDAPPDWNAAPAGYASEELLPLPKLVTLAKTEAALCAAIGAPVTFGVAIDEIMQKMGSDERDGMLTWMDDALFANYGTIFAEIHSYLPLKGRLRGVRIEAADWHEDRMLALDGNDVVFRFHFPHNDGHYSDGWVRWALPGVLSGLPETFDAAVKGHRLLPRKDEAVSVEAFRERAIPRAMKKISALIGRPVRLDLSWDNVDDEAYTARALTWFGVNRVWGGIARSSLDPKWLAAHRKDLKTIRIVLVYQRDERAAKYANGVLELSIDQTRSEHGGFYESDIAAVLEGQSITGMIAVDGSTSVLQ